MSAKRTLMVACGAVLIGAAPLHAAEVGRCADPRVGAAVRSAIETRIGRHVDVTLDGFTCALVAATASLAVTADRPVEADAALVVTADSQTTPAAPSLAATPDPLARTGKAVHFAIVANTTGPRAHAVRLGQATAVVRVSAEHVRVRAALPAGTVLAAGDLENATGPLENVALRRMPKMEELIGARLTRGLASGQVVPADAVQLPPAVKFGEQVQLTVRESGIEISTRAVAAQNAAVGQVIRVVNATSRRPLRARVTAPGEVEVVQ